MTPADDALPTATATATTEALPAAPQRHGGAFQALFLPIHRAGWPFIAAFAAVTASLALVAQPLGWLGAVLTLWCAWFFRDPVRTVPSRPGLVVSPADGVVQMITRTPPPPELGMGETPMLRVTVFLNIFNVHINRVPVEGTVTQTHYHPGAFLNAALDKASVLNERMSVRHRLLDGREIAYVQIAGLIARRILCHIKPGQRVATGERFGLIRFGSRMDVYLPEGTAPLVVVGQTAIAGETILADLLTDEGPRDGVQI